MTHMKFQVRTVSGEPVFEDGAPDEPVECEFGSLEQLKEFAIAMGESCELIVNFGNMTIRIYDQYE